MTPAVPNIWLDTANRIADRIIASARWSRDGCTWVVRVPDRVPGARGAHGEPAPGTLYQGTSGTALFLIELYRLTRAPEVLATATGALEHALSLPELPVSSFGLYSGRVGLAYLCYRFAVAGDQPEYLRTAEELLHPLVGMEASDRGRDVISGAAGAVPALLQMADRLPGRLTRRMAIALGEQLIRTARSGIAGWSWSGTVSSVRDLTGYAHGASGFGHALLELFQATGDDRFLYGAERAFAYEREFFDPATGNWPDFRYLEISEYLAYGLAPALRERLQRGGIPPFTPTYGAMWCHGAPGIGLARLRAFELLGEPPYAEEGAAAVTATLVAVRNTPSNYSLCHGYLGNCETLLYAARVLGRPELLGAVQDRALVGRNAFELEGRAWPCGTVGGTPDPSLMLGEAGIGYFYLRLYSEATPRLLFLTPAAAAPPAIRISRDTTVLRLQSVDHHFGVTLRAFARLMPGTLVAARVVSPASGTSELVAAHEAIERLIDAEETAERRDLMADAFAVERARFAILDPGTERLAAELLADVTRLPVDEVSWETAVLRRDERVSIVRTRHDWARWLEAEGCTSMPEVEVTTTAVWRANGEVHTGALSPFTALVLECVEKPGTVSEITRRVGQLVDGTTAQHLASVVIQQLKAAYEAYLVRCTRALQAAPVVAESLAGIEV